MPACSASAAAGVWYLLWGLAWSFPGVQSLALTVLAVSKRKVQAVSALCCFV